MKLVLLAAALCCNCGCVVRAWRLIALVSLEEGAWLALCKGYGAAAGSPLCLHLGGARGADSTALEWPALYLPVMF